MMIVFLFSVGLLISAVNSAGITSLMDLPLTMSKGNYMIHATLTDMDNGKKYFMQEFISSGSVINGLIVVDTPTDTYNVYYNLKDKDAKDNYERLLIQNTDCSLYQFKNISGTLLPGVAKRLTSLLLAMGPSILYRIDHGSIVWKSAANETVRGTVMKSFTTKIASKLDITYYHKSTLTQQEGLQQPSRIVFSGTNPYYSTTIKERLILDIYLQEMDTKNDYKRIVQLTPGIGCPVYYSDDLPLPEMNGQLVHMILAETVQGPTTAKTVSEIYAFTKLKLLRLKTSILGITTEAIYDYGLGVVFMFQDGGSCNVLPAAISSPGIDYKSGKFDIKTLFQLDGEFKYLGEIFFEHRAGFVVKAWESIQYNVITSNGKYDKLVITQYFTDTTNTDAFNGYMIVATTLYAYKLDASGKNYQLVEITTRDYMDFQVAESESEFHDKFTLNSCKYFTSDMTLTFQLGCKGSDCIKFAEGRVYDLKERFKETLLTSYDISPLRLNEMDVTFGTSKIDIRVDFLEAPNLQSIIAGSPKFVSDDSLKLLTKISAASELDCFSKLATSYNDFDVAVYCADGNVCGTLNGINQVKEDDQKGHACQLVHVPLHNLQRISREIMLKDLQSRLIQDTSYKTISLKNGYMAIDYKVVDILDETRDTADHSRDLFFSITAPGQNLDLQDPNVIVVPNVKTYGDCYRACASSDELDCRSLAYCSDGKSAQCSVTNIPSANVPIDKKNDPNCAIFSKNVLLEYSPIHSRRFKVPGSVSQSKWVDECASECSTTQDCNSFQYCDQVCILSGHYTDSSTEYDETCSIYIPKVSHKYQATGRKIVAEGFHTEVNLNIDQCAALCYNWADEEASCRSFNFCPKGRSPSSCSLTKYSVKDSATKTIEVTNSCFNYELIESKSDTNKQSTSKTQSKGTSGSAAFGIIVVFLVTGLLFGLVVPIVYSQVKAAKLLNRSTSIDQRFIWSRQVDDQTES